jgi:hypothetical protein
LLLRSQAQYGSDVITYIAEKVRLEHALAKAAILTGSAARDEATFLYNPSGTLWLSDIEMVVVIPDSASLADSARELRLLSARLEQDLKEHGTSVAVDLQPASEGALRAFQRNLFGYEFRVHGKQLFGDRDYLKDLPALSAREIPMEDAWRLLSNRMVEWLDFGSKEPLFSAPEQFYRLTKQYLDLITSLSLIAGRYSDRYETRAAVLTDLQDWLSHRPRELPMQSLFGGATLAYNFKRNPNAPEYAWLLDCKPEAFRAGLASAGWSWMADDLSAIQVAAWDWELATLSSIQVTSPAAMLRAIPAVYTWRPWLKGWARLVLKPDLRDGAVFFTRFARLFPVANPRGLVFLCARLLADPQNGGSEATLNHVRRLLPVMYPGGSKSREHLVQQCVTNWKAYLRS